MREGPTHEIRHPSHPRHNLSASKDSLTARPEYVLSKTFQPQGYTFDNAPLAVSRGEIFWLTDTQVHVYDTAGTLVRSFGDVGPGSLVHLRHQRRHGVFHFPAGMVDSVVSPLEPAFRNQFTKLEWAGGPPTNLGLFLERLRS